MRTKLLLVCLVLAGIIALWWIVSRQEKEGRRSMVTTPSLRAKATTLPSPAFKGSSGSVSQVSPFPNPSPPPSFEVQAARFNAAFLTPIAFYGRVLDQFDEPVTGADVLCYAADKPFKNGSQYRRTTDNQGLFAVEGAVGISLAVGVSKPGYKIFPPSDTKITSSGMFEYASGTNLFSPDRDHPVILRLYKIGLLEPLFIVGPQDTVLPVDGSPLAISLDQKNEHVVILRCWYNQAARAPGQRKYDWRVVITVERGELIRRENSFAFEAPSTGYSAEDAIEMPASMPRWDSSAERSYFFRFHDGTFARANVSLRVARNAFVDWQSFFNPRRDSRNLESDAPRGRLDF